MFQSLKTEHLPPENSDLDAKILLELLLHPHLCLPDFQQQCHLGEFLILIFNRSLAKYSLQYFS